METRVGTGFDVHPFEPGDAVWLGGVEIPHTHKLKGHSDADVALHALTDAIYGAIGEGDIGTHFPPSDPQWKGAASTVFLEHAGRAGGRARRTDRQSRRDHRLRSAADRPACGGDEGGDRRDTAAFAPNRIAIKATTSEQLGFTGRGEGIVAMASASIELPRED